MTTKKDEQASIRSAFRKELGVDIGVKMAKSVTAALESTKTEWFECNHCHKKNPLVLPNAFERAKACQMVVEQLEGKVGTHREAPAQAKVTAGDFTELSDDDLLALLQTEEPEEESDEIGD
jgi:hypothetical protein